MRILLLAIVLVGGAVITTVVDRILGVEVKSPNPIRRIVHMLLLMAQGGIILELVLH